MAKLFLESTDTSYKVSSNNTTVFGATGDQAVIIDGSLTGVVLDANVERVQFTGSTTDYKFKQVGTDLEIYNAAGTLVTKVGLQDDATGTQLTFANGTVKAAFAPSATGLGLTVGGVTVDKVAPTAATIAAANIDTSLASALLPSFSVTGAATATEGGNALFTVTLANPSATTATTVKYALTNLTTTTSADFGDETAAGTNVTAAYDATTSGTLTFAPGATTATITVPVTFDSLVETGEGVTLTLSAPSAGIVSSTGAAITTAFADAPAPTFTMTSSATAGISTQEGRTITFTVTPTGIVNAQTVLNLNMVGSALGAITATTSAADFTTASPLIFAAGDTAAKTVTVTVVNDSVTEGLEAYKAQLLDSSYNEKAAIQGTVADATPTVTLTAGATSVNEGAALTFTATSDMAAPAGGLVVPVTFGGTATAADYTTSATSITIAAGATTGTLTLNAIADNLTDGADTVTATLGSVNGATTVTTAVSATINDTSLSLAANAFSLSGAATANEGTSVVYTITRGAAATVATTVPYTITGTATSGTDYTAQTGTATFAIGATTATITLPITADLLTEGSETVIVTLGTPSVATDIVTAGAGVVTTTIADTSIAVVPVSFTLTTGIDTVTSSYNAVSAIIDQVTAGTNTTWNLTDSIATSAGGTINLNLLSHANNANGSGRSSTTISTLNIKVTDTADASATASSLNLNGLTGLTTVNVANSSVSTGAVGTVDTLTLSGFASTTALGINTNGQFQDVVVNGADFSGTADTVAVAVAGRNGALSFSTGVETVALTTTGTGARLSSLNSVGTPTNKTVTVAGSGLKIDGIMDNTITSFDASNSSGAVNVYLVPGSVLTSAKGGSGTADTLAIASLPSTLTTISGFERLQVEGTATYDLTNATGVATLVVDVTAGGTIAPTFTNAAATQNAILVSGGEQRTTAANATSNLAVGNIGYALKTATGTADALALTLNNGGVTSSSTTVGTLNIGTVTPTAIENVTVNVADFKAVTFTGFTLSGSSTSALNLTVPATSANTTLGAIAITHGAAATTPDIINLSAVTGTTTETVSGTGALTFSGGTGVDTVTQTGAIVDTATATYNLGAGNDVITVKSALAQATSLLVVNGDAGDDTINLDGTTTSVGTFTFNGGDGIDSLIVSGVANAKTLTSTISGIEKINFQVTTAAATTLALTVATNYAETVLITDVGADTEAVTVTSTGSVSLANWTQLGMAAAAGTDSVSVSGSGTIKGMAAYATTFTGGTSADVFTGGTGIDTYNIAQANSNSTAGIDTISNFVGGTDVLNLATAGAGTVNTASANADVFNNSAAVASTGTTIVTLLANLNTVSDALAANAFDHAGDTFSVQITGASWSGTDVYYVVQNDGANTTVTAADTIIALIGTSTAAISVATIV